MIKRLAMTIALAGLSGGAFAADLRGPIIDIPPPPVQVAAFGWTGAYVGANVGLGASSSSFSYSASAPGTPGYCGCDLGYIPAYPGYSNSGSERMGSGGVIGGVQAGYNYAFGGARGFGFGGITPVFGIEADFDGSGVSSGGALRDFASGNLTGGSEYLNASSHLVYFGTVRGRFGVAFDRLFVFGTGGFAYGDTVATIDSPQNNIYKKRSSFHTGYAYGGGVEYAVTNNLSLRAEYLHLDLNRKGTVVDGSAGNATYSIYEKPSLDLVRAGLDYKFDFGHAIAGPVVARY